MLARHRGVILPAGIAEHDIAGREACGLRGDDLRDAAAGHHRVGLDRGAIGGAVHPGPVGGVERDITRSNQHLAVLRRGHRAIDHLEMFRPELAGRFLDQQNLTIDGVAHDVLSPRCHSSSGAFRCNWLRMNRSTAQIVRCLNASRRVRFSQQKHSSKATGL
jgi:hypothetical protein